MLKFDDLVSSGAKPRVHGNGFIQLDLVPDGSRRLHIFHKDIPHQTQATPIHDHVFDMRSEVMQGTLIHQTLDTIEMNEGTHRVFRAQQEPGTQNTVLVPDEGEVALQLDQNLILNKGSVYTFPAGHLHQTVHDGLTITVMEKLNAPDSYGRPRVLVPKGCEPDNDFDREGFDQGWLWSFIKEALL